jgi:cell wall-associated NlpC family hydrolase
MASPRRLLKVVAALGSATAAALGSGCASAPARPTAAASRPAPTPPAHDAETSAARLAVATASSLAGHKEIVVGGVSFGDGCAALVRAAYQQAGRTLPSSARDVASLHALARDEGLLRRARPVPGDLVFLADRPGGQAEHVGLVERVGAGGTVTLLHRTGRGVVRVRVNPGQPWKARGDDGQILNDVLVVGGGRVSAGRLLVAYATLL